MQSKSRAPGLGVGRGLRTSRLRPLIVATLLVFAGSGPCPAAADASSAPTPAYALVNLFGVDFVDAHDLARHFGLTAEWTVPDKKLRLKNRDTTIDLTVDSLDLWLNGLHLFLGEPAVLHKGRLYVCRSDTEKLLAPLLAPQPAPGQLVPALKTIVLDAGHGGNDPGTQNSRLKLDEKNFTLDVAIRLEALLKTQGYTVVMTRREDRAVELDERTELIRSTKADLFVSIHFNAFHQERVAGSETYVMPPRHQHSTPAAETDKAKVAANFPSNQYDRWNILLGYQMHRQVIERLQLPDRGLKRYRYRVLCMADCPAVLVEAAFISNDDEGRKVATQAYRQQIAETVAAGIAAYAAALDRLRPAP